MANAKVVVGNVPETAGQGGSVNNPVEPSVRAGGTPRELVEGPQLGEKGEYRPAAYEVKPGLVRVDS